MQKAVADATAFLRGGAERQGVLPYSLRSRHRAFYFEKSTLGASLFAGFPLKYSSL